jgi:hypothetical protein
MGLIRCSLMGGDKGVGVVLLRGDRLTTRSVSSVTSSLIHPCRNQEMYRLGPTPVFEREGGRARPG